MNRPTLLGLSGWAHPPEALAPLAKQLAPTCDVRLPATPEEALAAAAAAPAPVFLLGWSLGGLYLLERAVRLPAPVAGLILVASTPCFCATADFPAGVPPRNVRALARALQQQPEPTLTRFFGDVAAPAAEPEAAVQAAVQAALRLGLDALRAGLQYLQLSDWQAAAKSLQMPVLALHGLQDRIIPWQAGQWFAQHCPRGQWQSWPQAGHDLPRREAAAVADAIAAFIRRVR